MSISIIAFMAKKATLFLLFVLFFIVFHRFCKVFPSFFSYLTICFKINSIAFLIFKLLGHRLSDF